MKRYIKNSESITFQNVELEDEEQISRIFGSLPVEKYYIASPGWYGYGGYGSDYDITFYILDDGRCVANSEYTGEEEFANKAEMNDRIVSIQNAIRAEIEENLESGEMGEEDVNDLIEEAGYDFL